MAKKKDKETDDKKVKEKELSAVELQQLVYDSEDRLSREERDAYCDIYCMDNFFDTKASFFKDATTEEVEKKFPGFDGELTDDVIGVLYIAKLLDELFTDAIDDYDDLDD